MNFPTIKKHLAFLSILVTIIMVSCSDEKKANNASPPTIQVVEAEEKSVPIYEYFVGQVYGQEDVSINARVEGYLTGIHFEEGSRVKKGDLLYSIDPEPFYAALASEKSKVAQAQTMLVNAENELARYKPLAEKDAVSQSDLDYAQANRDASLAAMEAAKASQRMAEINLGYTRMKAPISGFIGKTIARIGEFVGRNPNPVILNVVSEISSVRVQFFITENQYLALARQFNLRQDRSTAQAENNNEKARIELILSDGTTHPYTGNVDFINREVDAETGAILVQATFPNPDLILRPGQFGRVKIMMENASNLILVPQRCVSELQGQYSVFVVGEGNKIEARQIKIRLKHKDYYVVSEGLQAKDMIVYEGLQKVGTGMEVSPSLIKFESQVIED